MEAGSVKQLIYKLDSENPYVVLEIDAARNVTIFEPALRLIMENIGVQIHSAFQRQYGGKAFVKLGDPQFAEAFERFQFPRYTTLYTKGAYTWKNT